MIGLKQSCRDMLSKHGSFAAVGFGGALAQPLTAMHAKTTSSSFLIALIPRAETVAL